MICINQGSYFLPQQVMNGQCYQVQWDARNEFAAPMTFHGFPLHILVNFWSNGRKSCTEKNVLPGIIVLLALTGFSEAYPQQLGDIYINYSVGTPANEL